MANITFRMDDELKTQAEAIFKDMGLSMTTAFTIFTKAVIREKRIPFEITVDPFYSAVNQARLNQTIEEYETGTSKPIIKTMGELEGMEQNE